MGLFLLVEVVFTLLLGALTYCSSKSALDSLVLLSAGSDWRCGIFLTPQRSANASIESAGPVGRNSHHSAKGSDR